MMRETLDCGVLILPTHKQWICGWVAQHGSAMSRIRLHSVALNETSVAQTGATRSVCDAPPVGPQILAQLAMSLRRFDVCLLPVAAETLGWTRTALSCARADLYTPLVALTRGLRAAAVQDLLMLGVQDFVREPLCAEELRVRLERLVTNLAAKGHILMDADDDSVDRSLLDGQGALAGAALRLGEPHTSYAGSGREPGKGSSGVSDGFASEWANYGHHVPNRGLSGAALNSGVQRAMQGRPRVLPEAIDAALLTIQAAARIHPDEPFRVAKSRVVDTFERDYVRTALSRHAGNVARAARASCKHRRAFWALMRKHHIDATPYRSRRAGMDSSHD
jgi:CheY-like chemotaxis protein